MCGCVCVGVRVCSSLYRYICVVLWIRKCWVQAGSYPYRYVFCIGVYARCGGCQTLRARAHTHAHTHTHTHTHTHIHTHFDTARRRLYTSVTSSTTRLLRRYTASPTRHFDDFGGLYPRHFDDFVETSRYTSTTRHFDDFGDHTFASTLHNFED